MGPASCVTFSRYTPPPGQVSYPAKRGLVKPLPPELSENASKRRRAARELGPTPCRKGSPGVPLPALDLPGRGWQRTRRNSPGRCPGVRRGAGGFPQRQRRLARRQAGPRGAGRPDTAVTAGVAAPAAARSIPRPNALRPRRAAHHLLRHRSRDLPRELGRPREREEAAQQHAQGGERERHGRASTRAAPAPG